MIWYVRRGEREIGPLGDDALRALVGTGQITSDTRLWREELPGWTEAAALPGVLGPRAAFAPALQPSTAVAGATWAAAPTQDGTTHLDPAGPWRRYWARCLDVWISLILVSCLVGSVWPGLVPWLNTLSARKWIILPILLPFAMAMDSLIHGTLGNTPGKAIAGIKVLEEGGRRPLSALVHLGRNLGVYAFGLGLGFAPATLLTSIYGYLRVATGGASLWDRYSRSRVYALSSARVRTWIAAGLYLLAVAALFALGVHGQHERARYAVARTPFPVVEQELTQAANRVNASTPRMIDDMTRLDGAHAGPGTLFTYEYTLTNIRARLLSPTTLESLRWRLSAHVRQAVCRGTRLQPLLHMGAEIRFHYRDQDGQELVLASVSNADCAR